MMTDNEIIKAFECCHGVANGCTGCPYGEDDSPPCSRLEKDALDLINRQKEEIESLNNEVKEKTETITLLKDQATGWSIDFCNLKSKLENAKSEAIKGFAEKLKEDVTYFEDECGNFVPFVDCRDIEKLLETTGEKT